MRKRAETLITIQGIILAALLVWASFWTQTYTIYTSYHKNPDPVWPTSLVLGVIFVASFFSILGIIFAIFNLSCKNKWLFRSTLTLWGYTWTSMIILIIFSFVPLFIKAWRGDQYWHSLTIPTWLSPQNAMWIFIGGSLAILLLWQFCISKILEGKLGRGKKRGRVVKIVVTNCHLRTEDQEKESTIVAIKIS